ADRFPSKVFITAGTAPGGGHKAGPADPGWACGPASITLSSLPVEPLQGLAVRKASFPDPPRDGAFPTRVGLRPQQQVEEVQMRELLFLRSGQQLVQRYAFQRNPQRRAVAQTPVTQRGRRLRRFHRGSP